MFFRPANESEIDEIRMEKEVNSTVAPPRRPWQNGNCDRGYDSYDHEEQQPLS